MVNFFFLKRREEMKKDTVESGSDEESLTIKKETHRFRSRKDLRPIKKYLNKTLKTHLKVSNFQIKDRIQKGKKCEKISRRN